MVQIHVILVYNKIYDINQWLKKKTMNFKTLLIDWIKMKLNSEFK